LDTCQAWKLKGQDHDIARLLGSIENSLYFFEPGSDFNVSPLDTASRSISFLSPRPSKIRNYAKQNSLLYLHMPVWTRDELLWVAREEEMDARLVLDNYDKFGGIIRNTLETNPHDLAKELMTLDIWCDALKANLLLRHNTNYEVDDSLMAGEIQSLRISGRVACYTDIPLTGDKAFINHSLAMPSTHVNCKVLFNLGQASLQDAIKKFATDITIYLDEW
jgi:hypothetical protein